MFKRFEKLNVNIVNKEMIKKNVKHVELNTEIVRAALNTQTVKIINRIQILML